MLRVRTQNAAFIKDSEQSIKKRGKNRTGHQLYKCSHCGHSFTEAIFTPLYRKHISEEEMLRIVKLFAYRSSIRSIERITGRHRDTISRLINDLIDCKQLSNQFLSKFDLSPYEMKVLSNRVKQFTKTKLSTHT
jgi:transposase-like protein